MPLYCVNLYYLHTHVLCINSYTKLQPCKKRHEKETHEYVYFFTTIYWNYYNKTRIKTSIMYNNE